MKRTVFVIALLLSTCGATRSMAENTWSPTRSVRIVVPFQAGGPIDTIGRIVAQQLNQKWGQSFVVENRTGGGGNMAWSWSRRRWRTDIPLAQPQVGHTAPTQRFTAPNYLLTPSRI